MKVLTAAEMREVDRRAIEAGIPAIVLMENAGHRVVELLEREFAPLVEAARGGVLRQGEQRRRRVGGGAAVINAAAAGAAGCRAGGGCRGVLRARRRSNWRMFEAVGGTASREIPVEARAATVVVDALLGTGIKGCGERALCGVDRRDQYGVSAGESGGGGHSVGLARRSRRCAPTTP